MIRFNFNAFFFDLASKAEKPLSKSEFAKRMGVGASTITMIMQRGTMKASFYNSMKRKFRDMRMSNYVLGEESVKSKGQKSMNKISA